MRPMFLKTASIAAILVAQGASQTVWAQEASAGPEATGLEEIIVTARRTEERLQDVPVAVTAFNQETLLNRNVTDIQTLSNVAPGLTVTPANSPTTLIVTIRGLGNTNPNTGADASVGFYLNEVPVNLQNGTNVGMFDLEGVQVLKGPQGTLFGRNTTGGAILISYAKPTDRFEGYVKAGGTFFRAGNGYQAEGVVNVPVAPTLALRAGVSIVDRDGYVRNIVPRNLPESAYGFVPLPQGRTNYKNEMPQRSKAWRLGLAWEPSDTVKNTLFYDGSDVKSTGLPTYATALNPVGPSVTFAPFLGFPDPTAAYATLNAYRKKYWWAMMSVANNPLRLKTHTVSNTTEIQLGEDLTLKNIFGYRHVRERYSQDIVGLISPYYDYRVRTGGYNLSDELQLQGQSAEDRLKWVVGLFYFKESRFTKFDHTAQFGGPGGNTDFVSHSRSISGFAQATFKVTDALSLTAGGRYTSDKRNADLSRPIPDATGKLVGCTFPGRTVANCNLDGHKSFNAFTYTLSADYKVDPSTLIYVASRRGYRSGGFSNTQVASSSGGLIPFEPERIVDYELGFKRDWSLGGDAQLRTNLAVFHQDYSNIQRLAVDAADFTNQIIINVPKAKVDGGELELTLVPFHGLSLNYGYAYVRPRYKSFIVGGVDNSKNTFSYAPHHTHTFSGTLDIPVGESAGNLALTVDWTRRSSAFHDDQIQTTRGGVYPANTLAVPAYDMVGANLRWTGIFGSHVDAELFVTNLTNAKVLPNGTPNTYPTLGNAIGFYGVPPRMYGFNLRYNFGQ